MWRLPIVLTAALASVPTPASGNDDCDAKTISVVVKADAFTQLYVGDPNGEPPTLSVCARPIGLGVSRPLLFVRTEESSEVVEVVSGSCVLVTSWRVVGRVHGARRIFADVEVVSFGAR